MICFIAMFDCSATKINHNQFNVAFFQKKLSLLALIRVSQMLRHRMPILNNSSIRVIAANHRHSPPMTPFMYPNEDHWPRVLTAISQPMTIELVNAWLVYYEFYRVPFWCFKKLTTHRNDWRKNSRISPHLILFRTTSRRSAISNHE